VNRPRPVEGTTLFLLDPCWTPRCKWSVFRASEDGLTLTNYVLVSEDEQGRSL
jgi:hypothetical protein